MIIYISYLSASSIITSNIPRSAGTWQSCHPRQDLTQKYMNIHFQFHLLFSHLPHSCKCLYSLRTKVATQPRSQVFLIVRTYAPVWSLKYMVILHFQGNCKETITLAAFYCRKMETTLQRSIFFLFLSISTHKTWIPFKTVVFKFPGASDLLKGFAKTDSWAPSPSFLIQ